MNLAYAMGYPGGGAGGAGALMSFLPLIIILLVLFLLCGRPLLRGFKKGYSDPETRSAKKTLIEAHRLVNDIVPESKRIEMKYCPKCNTGYDQRKTFCGRCGVPLSSPSVKTENLTDETLQNIVTEDFGKYSAIEVAGDGSETEKGRAMKLSEIMEDVNTYLETAKVPDKT